MNVENLVETLMYQPDAHPVLSLLVRHAIVLQFVLTLAVLWLLLWWHRRVGRRKTRHGVVYRFRGLRVHLDPAPHSGVIGVSSGWRRFTALPLGIDKRGEVVNRTVQAREVSYGTTSGTMTTSGSYVLPQTVVITRYLPEWWTFKQGTRYTLTFPVLVKGKLESRSFRFYLKAKHEAKFEALWSQLMKDLAAIRAAMAVSAAPPPPTAAAVS